jgi:hypothetical protein
MGAPAVFPQGAFAGKGPQKAAFLLFKAGVLFYTRRAENPYASAGWGRLQGPIRRLESA